jgi:hypothetical protein
MTEKLCCLMNAVANCFYCGDEFCETCWNKDGGYFREVEENPVYECAKCLQKHRKT